MCDSRESVPGELIIEDSVLDKIAATAAETVEGVYSLGRSGLRGAIGSAAGGTRGVASEHGKEQAAFDFDLIVEYGHNIPSVVASVREAVSSAILAMTNLDTVEINIEVRDIHHPAKRADRELT